MATVFGVPDKNDLVWQVMDEAKLNYHSDLHDGKVKVGILFATNPDEPAIKKNGYAVGAIVKILSIPFRLLSDFDVLIILDEDFWKDLISESKMALFDNLLSRLALVDVKRKGENIVFKKDDIGRPKLRNVRGDWNGGDGFRKVIERHGKAAIEWDQSQRSFLIAKSALDGSFHESANEEPKKERKKKK